MANKNTHKISNIVMRYKGYTDTVSDIQAREVDIEFVDVDKRVTYRVNLPRLLEVYLANTNKRNL